MKIRIAFFLVCTLFIVIVAQNRLQAQSTKPHATLFAWDQRVQNFMLDRTHDYGGTNFNQGLFREHLTSMSPEHEIDLLTYRYTLIEDYDWIASEEAYRLSMGSLNATDFAIENYIKNGFSIDDKNRINIMGYHEQNLRANRFLFYLNYEHEIAQKQYLGFKHSLSDQKKDLDAMFYYRYGDFESGMIQVEVTFLDWANNTVEYLADNSRNKYNHRYKVINHYENRPELFSFKFASPQIQNFRAELVGGLQTYSRKKVRQLADTLNFIDQEWAHYIGGLIEYSAQNFTAGITYQRKFSKLKRHPSQNSNYDLDFGNWQSTNQLGFFLSKRIKSFRLENWTWYEYNTHRLQGKKVPGDISDLGFKRQPFDLHIKKLKMKIQALRDPLESGIKTGLAFHAVYNYPQGKKSANGIRNLDFRRVYSIIRNYDARLTFTIGYRFNPHFYLLGGISYDVDGDTQSGYGLPREDHNQTWFDGGFGRFYISW